jgi:hypothetical protein
MDFQDILDFIDFLQKVQNMINKPYLSTKLCITVNKKNHLITVSDKFIFDKKGLLETEYAREFDLIVAMYNLMLYFIYRVYIPFDLMNLDKRELICGQLLEDNIMFSNINNNKFKMYDNRIIDFKFQFDFTKIELI